MKYDEAVRHFKKVLRQFPDFAPALRSLGACYELKGDFEEASEFYRKALDHNPRFSRALYYEVGNIYYKCGKYRSALDFFEEFDSMKALDLKEFTYNGVEERKVESTYYEKLASSIRACQIAMDSVQFMNISSVQNLGSAINSGADEYFPFLTNDGKTILYTSRKNERSDENLFFSIAPKGDWRIGEQVPEFNTKENEGMTSLVRDGRRLFFTACQRSEVLGTCDIWEARINGTSISEMKSAVGYANSGAWESQASISCDGSILFFASNREGGIGGADIWYSKRLDDGRWSEPVNLGANVNTSGDEEAPFITNDGNTLYFSSTGHLGLGEQDLFMSRKDADGNWGFAVNLGMPVNSAYRELGFFLSADGKTGYFASNRKGGHGGMDIYSFQLPDKLLSDPITYVEGFVLDSITKLPVKTTVHFRNRPAVQTDDDGRFFLCIKAKELLDMEIRAEDYHPYRNRCTIPQWDNQTFFTINILLDPLFRLPVYSGDLSQPSASLSVQAFAKELKHSILFDFDKAELKTEMVKNLERFLETALSGKPVRHVEIIGYADDVGTDAYNLVLSEQRAKTVGVFLKNKGIRVDKIYIEGRGATDGGKPKWENRRVEVVINLEQ